ncbi:methionyl-tRNA formyltransferase [Tenacibaculum sp. M341]|uniref:methionyl-tRNA formyltransferase n=1 Tax=Tenacibaculum sp. M341 TaxID=2530339 RepID=UPI00104D55CE|nr:methionyl-tRNA formyltransferase [Tenacibaculum sp. M341]TCI91735.1 methionyl-tRNA formyltransferase [Tenacibaculum sp. M341]
MLKLGVLCSGNLGLSVLEYSFNNYEIGFILTDRKSKDILKFALDNNVPCFSGNPRNGKAYNFIKNIEVDVIASVNYLFLIEEDIINHSKKVTFNIHGSLLPKYRGRTPHVWSIINGEKETGVTAHLIDPECDTGEIIYQEKVEINENETGADILDKYKKLYIPLFDKVLHLIINDTIETFPQDESKASFYGKRTPEDGEINWCWNKEDIRNWVRAQAYPYPGAFSFFDNQKIIIDRVSVKEGGASFEEGTILSVKPKISVKARNGVVVLEEIRTKNNIFEIDKKFKNENR